MVIDTSALIAILFNEPERRSFNEAIEAATDRAMSAATFVEASIVVEGRRGADGVRLLDQLIDRSRIKIVGVDDRQARTARLAWSRFGKGRHKAALNYGDCFSYALAKERGQPLLFKGEDFEKTDVAKVALPSLHPPGDDDPDGADQDLQVEEK